MFLFLKFALRQEPFGLLNVTVYKATYLVLKFNLYNWVTSIDHLVRGFDTMLMIDYNNLDKGSRIYLYQRSLFIIFIIVIVNIVLVEKL